MLTVDDFPEFFALLNRGHLPFAWQRRLMTHVVGTGRWPDEINAPTGAGKSSVVDVHVFANAMYAVGTGPRVPRRLAVVVNRRALVDSHLLHAQAIATALAAAEDGLLANVDRSLRSLTDDTSAAVHCVSLRGGVRPGREWIDDPRVCSVVAATPDMWGSRVLFNAYGSGPRARPREAGLLAVDAVAVLDEAHLSRQLHVTGEVVAALVQASEAVVGVPGLQVVATTATPGSAAGSDHEKAGEPLGVRVMVGVDASDLVGPQADTALVNRLTRPKPVNYHASPHVPVKGRATPPYVTELATLALTVRADLPTDGPRAATVGCIVNHVDTAARLTTLLRKALAERGDSSEVICWVGRMRPMDLEDHRARYPGLFDVTGDSRVAFLVATQTVEVGIDLDLAGLVTELAPGTALAQRAGRVNRLGLRSSARVVVVGPEPMTIGLRRPYEAAELKAAYDWLVKIEATDPVAGLAPIRLVRALAPPQGALSRPVLSRLSPADALRLAETSVAPFVDNDLSFWLRDDLEREVDGVSIVVRSRLPEDDASARALVEATPPDEREMFPATAWDAQAALERVLEEEAPTHRAFLIRGEEITVLTPQDREKAKVRGGDVIVFDTGHPLTLAGVVVADPPTPAEPVETTWGDPDTTVWFAGEYPADLALLGDILGQSDVPEEDPVVQRELRAAAYDMVGFRADVAVAPRGVWDDEVPPWVAFRAPMGLLTDDELRQEWSAQSEAVSLMQHSEAVADRARRMAEGVGLPPALRDAVCRAGHLHDAGKADLRFQQERMRWDGTTYLAKSGDARSQDVNRRRGSGLLPRGWRHEQLSAAIAFDAVDLGPERDLVVRLVGTSHGHGRPFFPHGADKLRCAGKTLATDESVTGLFGNGSGWSDLLDVTHRRFGVWGCAYLEAVLRAADCQVSREGS